MRRKLRKLLLVLFECRRLCYRLLSVKVMQRIVLL